MITMTILTHPFQVLLIVMVLTRLVRVARSTAADHRLSIPTLEHQQVA
jgi:hypothetical protein